MNESGRYSWMWTLTVFGALWAAGSLARSHPETMIHDHESHFAMLPIQMVSPEWASVESDGAALPVVSANSADYQAP